MAELKELSVAELRALRREIVAELKRRSDEKPMARHQTTIDQLTRNT